jgi:hypothetical protein
VDRKRFDDVMIATLYKVTGIAEAAPLSGEDRQQILEIEKEVEKKGLMGLGKVVNSGVREVLKCDLIYVALTDMSFEWGCHPSLVLKKGQEVVGEEVRDKEVIARLSNQKNVWFMHKNFIVYRDRLSFPQDIINKICHFDIPCIPAEWCRIEDEAFRCRAIIYANPGAPTDLDLKVKYFNGADEKGLGTILVGVR